MRTDYNENSTDVDLEGLENAVREHAQRRHKLEREGAEQGSVILFRDRADDHEPQKAA